MNVGAAQADVAVLVVNATNGEFETGFDAGGQTREHTMLARSLGNLSVYFICRPIKMPSTNVWIISFCGQLCSFSAQLHCTCLSVCLSVSDTAVQLSVIKQPHAS